MSSIHLKVTIEKKWNILKTLIFQVKKFVSNSAFGKLQLI